MSWRCVVCGRLLCGCRPEGSEGSRVDERQLALAFEQASDGAVRRVAEGLRDAAIETLRGSR